MKRLLALALIGGVAITLSCTNFERKNPYDPEAPEALQAKAQVYGAVNLELGGDLAGTVVTLGSFTTQTQSDGSFVLDQIPPGGPYTLIVSRSGYSTLEVSIPELKIGEKYYVGTLNLSVLRGTLQGTVTLEESQSHEGAFVKVENTDYYGVTDATGNFVISGVPVGVYSVRITKSGYEPVVKSQISIGGEDTVDIGKVLLFLQRGDIQGKVVLEGDTDFSGVAVIVEGAGKVGYTDSQGNFLITQIPVGVYTLRFRKSGYEEELLSGVEVRRNKVSDAGVINLKKPPSPPQPIQSYQSDVSSVVFSWLPNSESDIKGYNIYHWSYENPVKERVNSTLISPSYAIAETYVATVTQKGLYHFFSVTAVDNDDLESEESIFDGFHELMPVNQFVVLDPQNTLDTPSDVIFRPDGRYAFVANYNGANISVIDSAQDSITYSISLTTICTPGNCNISDMAIDKNGLLYVVLNAQNKLAIIDTQSLELKGSVDVCFFPTYISTNPEGTVLYLSCTLDFDLGGTMSLAAYSTGLVPQKLRAAPIDSACTNIYSNAYANKKIYVLCGDNNIRVIDADPTSATYFTMVKVIQAPGSGEFLAASKDEKYIVVSLTNWSGDATADKALIIETSNDTQILNAYVDNKPQGIAITSQGAFIVHENNNPQLCFMGFSHLSVYYLYPASCMYLNQPLSSNIAVSPDENKFYIVRSVDNAVMGVKFEK